MCARSDSLGCLAILRTDIRGDPFITFAPRGGRGVKEVANFANDKTDRLRETANKGGGPKSRKICGRNKWMPPNDGKKYAQDAPLFMLH